MVEVPRRRRRASAGREALLRGAAEVIAERGVDQTRFSDVAARTGMAVSTLQYMFGSRDDLLAAALEFASEEDLAQLNAAIADLSDPVEQLHALTDVSIGPDEGRLGWLLWLEFWHRAARDPELNQRSRDIQSGWRQAVADVVRRGVQSGAFRPDLDPDDAAILIVAVIDGVALALILEDPDADFAEARRLVRIGVDRVVIGE